MIDILAEADVDFILLNYEKFMSDSNELKKLESFLNLPLKDCRNKNMKKTLSSYKKVLISRYISNLLILFNVMELKTIFNELSSIENRQI